MRRLDIFILAVTFATAFSMIILIGMGESRPDVYISITILIYYIFYSIINPMGERENRIVSYLNIILFIIFSVIVGYRVYEILYM